MPTVPPPVHSRTVRVGELDVHYLECGQGVPVLLVHGWPTNAQLYRHVLPRVGAGRRAIAIDLPGYGNSSKPPRASYSFRFYDRVITDFVDALEVERTGLVVHDIGGPIGLHWAVLNRARLVDVAILNTLVFPETSLAVKLFVLGTFLPGVRAALASPRGIRAALRLGVSDKSRITDEVAALYQAPFASHAARRALLRAAHRLHPRGFRTISDRLSTLNVPLRIVYGTQDRILPDVADTMTRLRQFLPHAETTAIDGCGHFLQEDRPELVAELLAEFFGR